jgi:protein-L-isoaspartate O-methyltransferase
MIIPVGRPGEQKLQLVTRKDGETVTRDISYVRFVPMTRGVLF